MTGGYDEVCQPLVIDERFDYVLFSNDFEESKIGAWQVRHIPVPSEIDATDNKRISRYPKTHPETMLGEYEASLYIDANIQIADRWMYDKCAEYAAKGVQFAGIHISTSPHPFAEPRDDIYEHMYDMCTIAVEHDYKAIKMCRTLYKSGFPAHYGLNENNVIYRLHTEQMRKCDEEWWWWIVNYSFRDQFSYMYCLWKHKIQCEYFFPYGVTARNTPHLHFMGHNQDVVKRRKSVPTGILERIRIKCKDLNPEKYNRYCKHWLWMIKRPYPQVWLVAWGIVVGIIDFPMIIMKYVRKKILKK